MSRSITFSLCLSLLFVTGLATGQQETPKEPQPPQPGPEHSHLKSQEGTWDCVCIGADGKRSKAVANSKMECGGLWLVGDFKGEFDGKPFQGKSLDTYDSAKKKYIGIWVDSMMTAPLILEGTRDAASKTTTSTGECPGPDGKPMKMKTVAKEIDSDHTTFELYMVGPDGKEAKMMTIEYTRRK